MAIIPENINTVRVGQLDPAPISGTDLIPHEVSGTLKRASITDLATFVAGVIGSTGAIGFRPVSLVSGDTLPATTQNEFILVGKGTYFNVGGGPDLVLTEELNAVVSNGTTWSLGVAIPIDVELAGIVQTIRAGFTQTAPSENAVYEALLLKANAADIAVPFPKGVEYTASGGETSFDLSTTAAASMMFYNGVPQSGSMWSQSGSTITLNFDNPLNGGDFMQFV